MLPPSRSSSCVTATATVAVAALAFLLAGGGADAGFAGIVATPALLRRTPRGGFSVGAGCFDSTSTRTTRFGGKHKRTGTTALSMAIRCEDKTYQLEEMEDKENSTTEVYLNVDRTIKFGQTDGPVWEDATGSWEVEPDTNNFKMRIVRSFGAGRDKTDMGEFQFSVERTYVGEMTKVGESVGITGVMHSKDPDAADGTDDDQEVGFFNMIDGTDEKAGYGARAESLRAN